MSVKNKDLRAAKQNKFDEFYTTLSVIEEELRHYKHHFKGKVVYCNCDDPRVSNFFHYFSYNFNYLGLKKLIATCYKNKEMDLFTQYADENAISLEYSGETDGGNVPSIENIGVTYLDGDGDFRSPESIAYLEEADIVVTNPPFSLFREYVAQLIEYDKQFLIIGNMNSLTYREIFKLIKEDKMWLGVNNGPKKYRVPDDHEGKSIEVDENGHKWQTLGNTGWFTNLNIHKRHEDIILYEKYSPEKYQKYENFDAINVDRVRDIPVDYEGYMGVPITFVDKYNPDQFEIIGLGISNSGKEIGVQPYKEEHRKYRKEVQGRGVVDGDLYMMEDGKVKVPYARIIIKNKKVVK